jgi:hypothetical protein
LGEFEKLKNNLILQYVFNQEKQLFSEDIEKFIIVIYLPARRGRCINGDAGAAREEETTILEEIYQELRHRKKSVGSYQS